ncbi:hypothetical protein Tco_0845914 [Tanacetum coccineum]
MSLWYPKDSRFELIAYSDAYHVGCKYDCKSTSGGLQFLGEKLVSWSSKKQDCTAMSIAEAEYVSLSACLIIMAQQQHAADVHPDELCPPNKRYDLMDANKKVDLEHVQCPPESKILTNIIKNHPLRFSIAASSSVPWIYMAQFWHTLKEDGSKYRLRFMLDKKELTLTLDDFRQIFHLPQATANNHNSFVPPPSFSDMVPFYKQVLGFTMQLKTSLSFKTTGLLQPWQTLCKIFSKCLTTRVTRWDQPALQIMQMLYCFVNNIHVDYAELLWEGLGVNVEGIYYSLSSSCLLQSIRTIFKDSHQISSIQEEQEQIVPLTQSQLTGSTQGTYRIPNALVPSVEKSDEMILQDMIQHLAAEEIEKLVEDHENVDDSSPPRNDDTSIPWPLDKDTPMVDFTNIVPPVDVYDEEDEITDEVFELRRRVKGKNVEETRISPIPSPTRSPKNLSALVSLDTEKLQELTVTHPTPSAGSSEPKLTKNQSFSIIKRFMPRTSSDQLADNIHDVHDGNAYLVGVNKRKRVILERKMTKEAQISSHIQNAIDIAIPSLVDASIRSYMSGHILHVHLAQVQSSSIPEQQHHYAQDIDVLQEYEHQITPLVQSCQRDPEAPALSLINQDLLYLKKGNSGPEKINPPCEDLLHQETERNLEDRKEEIFQTLRSFQVTQDYWELGHDYISLSQQIVARRANDCNVPDYANTGLLWSLSVFIRSSVIWERVHDFQLGIKSYQQKINLTAPTNYHSRIAEYDYCL